MHHFRFLPTDDVSDAEFLRRRNDYHEFLDTFDTSKNPDLWKFFRDQAFHDGAIDKIELSSDGKSLSFRIECPNIEQVEPKRYLSEYFLCQFSNLVLFEFRNGKFDQHNDSLREYIQSITYDFSEINTLTEPLTTFQSEHERTFNSLLIALRDARQITIIFEALTISPEDPTAFEKFLQDPNYAIPLFNPGQK